MIHFGKHKFYYREYPVVNNIAHQSIIYSLSHLSFVIIAYTLFWDKKEKLLGGPNMCDQNYS